ncbi:MAG: TlpA family protein disulfide reductase [Nocardioidaceae bacterium]
MTRAAPLLVAGLVVGALLLTGCQAEKPALKGEGSTGVRVDTPALRAAKRAAGITTCRTGADSPATGVNALPEIPLPCLGGGPTVTLSRLRGPLVINLFAQWCGPCRQELPYYQRLSRDGAGRVSVVGVDYLDTLPARAIALARTAGVTYPLLADPVGNLRAALHRPGSSSPVVVRGLPGLVFVDAEGRVTDVRFVLVRSYAQLSDLVRSHLGVDVS